MLRKPVRKKWLNVLASQPLVGLRQSSSFSARGQ